MPTRTLAPLRSWLPLVLTCPLVAVGCGDNAPSSLNGDGDAAMGSAGLSGFDEGAEGGDDGAGGLGVGQGGAQDFGQFKEILENGDIPGPETIDDVGFFN